MQLDENQKKTVSGWIEEGLDLSAIQSRLESEMDIPMTYMDVRFLVGDLELVPKDEEEPEKEPEEEPKPEEELAPVDGPTPDNPFPAPEDPMGEAPLPTDDVAGGGEVSVTVSPVTQAGMMASGSVTFTDGVKCEWHVDQYGRPSLIPQQDGYQPPEDDMPKFGQKLQQQLQGGY